MTLFALEPLLISLRKTAGSIPEIVPSAEGVHVKPAAIP
jgi:hypothetical protein